MCSTMITQENTMFKYQRTDGFTRKLRALLSYVHTTMYNKINYNRLHILIWFHKRRHFYVIVYVRASDSGRPVTYGRKFCTNKPSHKLYCCITEGSIRHHALIKNPTIIHTKTFFAPVCHPRKIYSCVIAHSKRHHTLLHHPMILGTKTFFAPTCHARQKIWSTSKYYSKTNSSRNISFFTSLGLWLELGLGFRSNQPLARNWYSLQVLHTSK